MMQEKTWYDVNPLPGPTGLEIPAFQMSGICFRKVTETVLVKYEKVFLNEKININPTEL